MFRYLNNLTDRSLKEGVEPWDFKPTENITKQIREDGESRQEWYQTQSTRHHFYTGIEAENPNQRPSKKDNPPRRIHAIVADIDSKIPEPLMEKTIKGLPFSPDWIERSLGGKWRLVWCLPSPIKVHGYHFCSYILTRFIDVLEIGGIPGLDRPAMTEPTRYYCNGCKWEKCETNPTRKISEATLNTFLIESVHGYNRDTREGPRIPMEKIVARCREKYPDTFLWDGEFVVETQGPSFWVPGSASPKSAIVKDAGIYTFSAHADKPFYTWREILGADFTKQFEEKRTLDITKDIYFDGRMFWRKKRHREEKELRYAAVSEKEQREFLVNEKGLDPKPGKDGKSEVSVALAYVREHHAITAAAPFIFRPEGVIIHQRSSFLNYCREYTIQPARGVPGRPEEVFPFINSLLLNIFTTKEQLPHFLAWFQYFYKGALDHDPQPGQCVFLMGPPGSGKTLLNREIVGAAVGGFGDASRYLIHGESFNSHLLEKGLWCIDDDTANDDRQHALFSAMLKKMVANTDHISNEKFVKAAIVNWVGRVFCTMNTDPVSMRYMCSFENSSKDKINLFQCADPSKTGFKFPSRTEIAATIKKELPHFLRWLLHFQPPKEVEPESRFGYKAYHEPDLMRQINLASPTAAFRELVTDALAMYFRDNAEATEWRGTANHIMRLLRSNPLDEAALRGMSSQAATRYLETFERDKYLDCSSTGRVSKIWVFPRFDAEKECPNDKNANFMK